VTEIAKSDVASSRGKKRKRDPARKIPTTFGLVKGSDKFCYWNSRKEKKVPERRYLYSSSLQLYQELKDANVRGQVHHAS